MITFGTIFENLHREISITEGAYQDPLFIEILKEGEDERCSLYHFVLLPKPQASTKRPEILD